MAILDQYQTIILDLDGTLYKGQEAIPGASLFVEELRQMDKDIFFLTNNATRSVPQGVAMLAEHGIKAYEEEFYHSGLASRDYLLEQEMTSDVFLLASQALANLIEEAGIQTTTDPKQAKSVLSSMKTDLTYNDLAQASLAIQEGADFILTNADVRFPTGDGFIPGAGAVGNLIENVSGKPAFVVGKPNAYMVKHLISKQHLDPERVLMIGDNLATDILCGVSASVDTVLVLSGVSQMSDLAQSEIQPTYVISELGDLAREN